MAHTPKQSKAGALLSNVRKGFLQTRRAVRGAVRGTSGITKKLGIPDDPLSKRLQKNQKAANKLRKLRIQNRIKRGGPGSKDLGSPGLRNRLK